MQGARLPAWLTASGRARDKTANGDPMRPTLIAALLVASPCLAKETIPPEVQALAEATCRAEEFCEMTSVQMFPGGEAAFLWLESLETCGARGCQTLVLRKTSGTWAVEDPELVTQPGSVLWLGASDLAFDGTEGVSPLCAERQLPIWHWTGAALVLTGRKQATCPAGRIRIE